MEFERGLQNGRFEYHFDKKKNELQVKISKIARTEIGKKEPRRSWKGIRLLEKLHQNLCTQDEKVIIRLQPHRMRAAYGRAFHIVSLPSTILVATEMNINFKAKVSCSLASAIFRHIIAH